MNQEHIRNLDMICAEWEKACEKHPKFCDCLTIKTERSLAWLEECEKIHIARLIERNQPVSAEYILNEEIKEALHAFKQGDKAHCLQELAQCGAVILRMMEFVQNEMSEASK